MLVQQLVQTNNNENLKAPNRWLFVKDDRWISLYKGPVMWKAFQCHGEFMYWGYTLESFTIWLNASWLYDTYDYIYARKLSRPMLTYFQYDWYSVNILWKLESIHLQKYRSMQYYNHLRAGRGGWKHYKISCFFRLHPPKQTLPSFESRNIDTLWLWVLNKFIAMKFNWLIGCTAAETPAKFSSDRTISNPRLSGFDFTRAVGKWLEALSTAAWQQHYQ